MIPTAEEFLIRNGCTRMSCDDEKCDFFEDVEPIDLILFAQLHVRAALEAADKIAECNFPEGAWDDIEDKSFILNSYPLTNIK